MVEDWRGWLPQDYIVPKSPGKMTRARKWRIKKSREADVKAMMALMGARSRTINGDNYTQITHWRLNVGPNSVYEYRRNVLIAEQTALKDLFVERECVVNWKEMCK